MSDLIERAAKHVAALNGHSDDWERFLDEARDYVNFAVEECAKAAEGFPHNRDWVKGSLYEKLRIETAFEIRKLAKGKP
jgi:hypothetical protein